MYKSGKRNTNHSGPLSKVISEYVTHKRAAGRDYTDEEEHLYRFDAFAGKHGCPVDTLPKEIVLLWIEKRPHEKKLTQIKRINSVKRFAIFLNERGYTAYVYPYSGEMTPEPYLPYIFTEEQIGTIIRLADQYKSTIASRNLNLIVPLVFRLLYGCGLRTSEVLNLRLQDLDTDNGVLRITDSKYGKSRLVPMAPSITSRCAEYNRLTSADLDGSTYMFRNHYGNRFSDQVIYHWFRELLARARISHGGKGHGPRVHDIRHTFAVHRLKLWAKEGRAIQQLLPLLSAYMGHCDLRGTQVYIRLTPDVFPEIAKTMDGFWESRERGDSLELD